MGIGLFGIKTESSVSLQGTGFINYGMSVNWKLPSLKVML